MSDEHAGVVAERLLVLDGGLDRELERRGVVLRPTPGAPPASVREPAAARAILLDAARAGADVLTAPTGGLQRRALARIGESRRAREWIVEAVRVARDAVAASEDAGLPDPERPDGTRRRLRLAGLVTPLEGAVPDLAPDRDAALEEHRVHAGLLADAGVDILRIEGMTTIGESDAAAEAAAEMGLETWSGVRVDASGRALLSGERVEAWLEAIVRWRPAILTVQAARTETAARAVAAIAAAGRDAGAILDGSLDEERVAALQRDGIRVVGPGADGSPERIAALRRVARRADEAIAARRDADLRGLLAWIAEGTRRAVSGRAAWVGPGAPERLPGSFAWDRVAANDLAALPAERYRLAVLGGSAARADAGAVDRIVAALEPGGWLLLGDDAAGDLLRSDGRLEAIQRVEPVVQPSEPRRGWLARRRP